MFENKPSRLKVVILILKLLASLPIQRSLKNPLRSHVAHGIGYLHVFVVLSERALVFESPWKGH